MDLLWRPKALAKITLKPLRSRDKIFGLEGKKWHILCLHLRIIDTFFAKRKNLESAKQWAVKQEIEFSNILVSAPLFVQIKSKYRNSPLLPSSGMQAMVQHQKIVGIVAQPISKQHQLSCFYQPRTNRKDIFRCASISWFQAVTQSVVNLFLQLAHLRVFKSYFCKR